MVVVVVPVVVAAVVAPGVVCTCAVVTLPTGGCVASVVVGDVAVSVVKNPSVV